MRSVRLRFVGFCIGMAEESSLEVASLNAKDLRKVEEVLGLVELREPMVGRFTAEAMSDMYVSAIHALEKWS